MNQVANVDAAIGRAFETWKPAEKMSGSAWADRNFYLSSEMAAVPGPWRTIPYQREILDAMTDPGIPEVTVMKSARVGYTLMMSAAIGYFIEHDPSSIMVVQPTVEDGKGYSKETIAPMLRDVPVLARIMVQDVEDRGRGPKDSSATLTHKAFPGGILSITGANTGTGLRRVSRRVVAFDEVDAYPPSAGSEGDPISLGKKRTESFWNRKILSGSTPTIAGVSRIEEMFEAGDQRRYYVPCPHCGHMDFLSFRERPRGHFMKWDEGKPETAYFVCRANGCVIEHRHKRWMVERGEWRADKPGRRRHRSYHIWSAYSYSPNASWGQIAEEFLAANKGGPEKLKTFVNTTLGETWTDLGEAPDYEQLYARREPYPIGSVPVGVRFLTAGVDVQKDRFVYEVVGWTETKESFSIDAGVLLGDTSDEASWGQLDALLDRMFPGADGRDFPIAMLAIDSGYNTQTVYNWGRRKPFSRVIACKGVAAARMLIGMPSPVDVTIRGKRLHRGYKMWPVGVDMAKSELYGWLRLVRAAGECPPGFCHFPEYEEEFFKQLTAEHLVTIRVKKGFPRREWQLLPNRQNHFLDTRILARAAASMQGLDRYVPPRNPSPRPPAPQPSSNPGSGGGGGGGRQPWLSGRRSWLGGKSGWLRPR